MKTILGSPRSILFGSRVASGLRRMREVREMFFRRRRDGMSAEEMREFCTGVGNLASRYSVRGESGSYWECNGFTRRHEARQADCNLCHSGKKRFLREGEIPVACLLSDAFRNAA